MGSNEQWSLGILQMLIERDLSLQIKPSTITTVGTSQQGDHRPVVGLVPVQKYWSTLNLGLDHGTVLSVVYRDHLPYIQPRKTSTFGGFSSLLPPMLATLESHQVVPQRFLVTTMNYGSTINPSDWSYVRQLRCKLSIDPYQFPCFLGKSEKGGVRKKGVPLNHPF